MNGWPGTLAQSGEGVTPHRGEVTVVGTGVNLPATIATSGRSRSDNDIWSSGTNRPDFVPAPIEGPNTTTDHR